MDLTIRELEQSQDRLPAPHDHLAQSLIVMRMKLRQVVSVVPDKKAVVLLNDVDQALTQALDYTRSLIVELGRSTPKQFGLLPSLEWLARQVKPDLMVEMICPFEAPTLPDDQTVLLLQSVRELLYNVIEHARTDSATVSLTITPNHVLQIGIEDQGCGFDPATLEWQGADPTRFGLLTIRERMATMGGRLSIDSVIGRGTRVTLQLPYWWGQNQAKNDQCFVPDVESQLPASSSEFAISESSMAGSVPHQKPHIRVLLVDDHQVVRQGLRSLLEDYPDIEVVGEAVDGQESLDYVERLRPAVVVMDLNMPKMNGIDATAAIKSRHPRTIIVGLSVNADHDNRTAMTRAGASALLTKEAAVDQLYSMIHQALAEQS